MSLFENNNNKTSVLNTQQNETKFQMYTEILFDSLLNSSFFFYTCVCIHFHNLHTACEALIQFQREFNACVMINGHHN